MWGNAKWFVVVIAAAAVQAQSDGDVRRATISGTGGTSGKCTIEVRVDSSAEVDVYGDSGRLRTLTGQPAAWTRFDCTSALPYNMSEFSFRGVDGRGTVRLLQDPRNNNSMAVIRIDDTRAGSEGYTFDIEWSGASGGSPTGGFQSSDWFGFPRPAATTPAAPAPIGNVPIAQTARRGTYARGTRVSAERALDLCRSEVHTRGERDYGLRNIDVTSLAVETTQGRRDWVTGTFNDLPGGVRRSAAYRFNCEVDYSANQVLNLEIARSDGSILQPGTQTGTVSPSTGYTPQGYNQATALRACQDAVVARANRDGYQDVAFTSTAIDSNRTDYVTGAITARRGPLTDTFNFGCSMDLRNATVRNVEMNRR